MSPLASSAVRKWSRIIAEQRRSGLTIAAFCRKHAVPASSLFAWRRRLAGAGSAPAFVEATVTDDTAPAGPDRSAHAGPIVLELPTGPRLHIGRGFDPQALRQILAILQNPDAGQDQP